MNPLKFCSLPLVLDYNGFWMFHPFSMWVRVSVICNYLLEIVENLSHSTALNLKCKRSEKKMNKKKTSRSIRLDDLYNENGIPKIQEREMMRVCPKILLLFVVFPKVGSLPTELHWVHIIFFSFFLIRFFPIFYL